MNFVRNERIGLLRRSIPEGKQQNMKNTALALAVVTLSICFGLQLQKVNSAGVSSVKATLSAVDERGSVKADTTDSDE